jgi:hypothetical protein
MLELTERQKSLEHILAFWFKRHPSMHSGVIKRNYPCPYCDALENLEIFMDAPKPVIQPPPLCYVCDGVMKKDSRGLVCSNCKGLRAEG